MMLRHLLITTLASFLVVGCSSKSKDGDAGSVEIAQLGSGYEYYKDADGIIVGPQPSAEDIKEFKSDGNVAVIINVRSKRENRKVKFNPKTVAKSVGIKYYQIPLMKNRAPNKAAAEKISQIVKKADGKDVLVYCSSGNRAAAWYGIHKAMGGETTTNQAVNAAVGMGLNNRQLKTMLTGFLASSGLTTTDNLSEMAQGAEEDAGQMMDSAEGKVEGGAADLQQQGEETMDSVEEALEPEDSLDALE